VAEDVTGPERPRPFAQGWDFPTAVDSQGVLARLLDCDVVPNGVLLDADGRIAFMHVGGFDVRRDDVRAHLEGRLDEQASRRVPVQPQVVGVHRHAPVGPNRSVLIRAGSWPSARQSVATASTSRVGPQMKTSGRWLGGQTTSASIARSIRRLWPRQPGGWARVSVWTTSIGPPGTASRASSSR
jgi:hypothetical protein